LNYFKSKNQRVTKNSCIKIHDINTYTHLAVLKEYHNINSKLQLVHVMFLFIYLFNRSNNKMDINEQQHQVSDIISVNLIQPAHFIHNNNNNN